MCRVASVRPCRIRITPKSWNRKLPQVKLRSELTISEQCSENISHKHALSYKKQRPALRVGIRPRRHTFLPYVQSQSYIHRIGFCSNLSIRIEDKARIVFAVVPLDAQLRMRNESCERAALAFALLHCTASTICTTHSLGRLSFNSTSGSS